MDSCFRIHTKWFTSQVMAESCQCVRYSCFYVFCYCFISIHACVFKYKIYYRCGFVPIPSYGDESGNIICLNCKTSDEIVDKPEFVNDMLSKQTILCPNNENVINIENNNNNNNSNIDFNDKRIQCKWEDMVSLWDEHKNECELALLKCKYCNKDKILRRDINKHYSECNEHESKCPNDRCNKLIKRKDMDNHVNNECEYKVIECPNDGCDLILIRKDYIKHKNTCKKRTVCCPYKVYGCNVPIVYDELTIHFKNHALQHCTLLANEINKKNIWIKKQKNEHIILRNQIKLMDSNLTDKDEIIQNWENKYNESQKQIEILKQENAKLKMTNKVKDKLTSIPNINALNDSKKSSNNTISLNGCTSPTNIIYTGYMHIGNIYDGTQYIECYCQLTRQPTMIKCFEDNKLKKQLNSIDLRRIINLIELKPKSLYYKKYKIPTSNAFQIILQSKQYILACKSKRDIQMWLTKIKGLISNNNATNKRHNSLPSLNIIPSKNI